MNKMFGFVAEPHRNNYWLVTPATKEGDSVTCHDCSGFMGSWPMKEGGIFFPCETDNVFCDIAQRKASAYAKEKNNK